MKTKLFLSMYILTISKVFCLSISPIDIDIISKSGQGYYTVSNDDKSNKVVSIIAKHRFIDENGQDHYTSTKDLIIYPKQVLLKPKEKRLVRIIWKAKKKIDKEIAYRISFTEKNADVDFGLEELGEDEKRAGMSFGIKFIGTVYVQPSKKSQPNINIESYKQKDIEGEKFLIITLENSGEKRQYIDMKELELEILSKKG